MPDQERVPQAATAADSKSHGPGIGQLLAAGAAADAVSKPPSAEPSRATEREDVDAQDDLADRDINASSGRTAA